MTPAAARQLHGKNSLSIHKKIIKCRQKKLLFPKICCRIAYVLAEMSEWFKEHDWKSCDGGDSSGGSNPLLCASIKRPVFRLKYGSFCAFLCTTEYFAFCFVTKRCYKNFLFAKTFFRRFLRCIAAQERDPERSRSCMKRKSGRERSGGITALPDREETL